MAWTFNGPRSAAAWVSVCLAIGCTNSGGRPAPSGDSPAAPPAGAVGTLTSARALAAPIAAFREAFSQESHFRLRADQARTGGILGIRPGDNASAPIEIAAAGHPLLRFAAEGAKAVPWQVVEGVGVAKEAYPHTDVIATTTPEKLELFFVLRDRVAPESFDYELDLESGYRVTPMATGNGFVIENEHGDGVLRIPPASAVDAAGTKRDVVLAVNDGRLTVRLDTAGLRFPVLVDPVLETFQWQQLAPGTKPNALGNAGMAYDAFRSQAVLFGGQNGGGNHADTYTWNGSNWTPACAEGAGCGNGITARRAFGIAYDSVNHLTMVFGGANASNAAVGDFWAWNGSSWSSKATGPAKRHSTALAYDSARSRTVLFGGFDSSAKADLWEYDGSAWSQRCTTAADPCFTDTFPSARYAHMMAFDAAHSQTVLVGGLDGASGNDLGDTWTWNGTHWSKKCDACVSARSTAILAYDSARLKVVLYGGYNAGAFTLPTDTLEWNGSTWTTTAASGGPGVKRGQGAYDAARGRLVVYGGVDSNELVLDQTWVYHARGGGCSLDTDCDTGHCVDGVCCETACNSPCQRCDQNPTPGVCTSFINGTDAECTGYCDGAGACQAKLAAGVTCATTYQCSSGVCSSADKVCCNSDCSGLCESCVAAKTGAAAGTCSPVKIATDPDGECPDDGAASCDRNGSCNGARACQLYAAATVCVAQSCSGTTLFAADTCTGSGACTDNGSSQCGTGYKCNAGGTACNTTCSGDGDCVSGYFCLSGACTAKRGVTEACTASNQCANGFCADGFCCNTACGAACDVCSQALGAPANGVCGVANQGVNTAQCAKPLACNGTTTTCAAAGSCGTDTDCGTGYYCRGDGTCSPQVAQGGTCDASVGANGCKTAGCRVCGTAGGCVGGVCCNTACGGACDICTVGTAGVCTIVGKGAAACGGYKCDGASAACPTTCATIADCATGSFCDANSHCIAKLAQGAACTTNTECSNGRCVDGFCCDSLCTNNCQACAAALKESGKDDGVCGPVRNGTDPRDDCPATDPSTCGTTGNCNGAGACAKHANTACGATSCVSGTAFVGQACDGFGNCKNQQTQQDCTPYVCSTTTNACANPCQADQDCQNPTQHRCVNGVCLAKVTNGTGCTVGEECLSGNCVDGVCCDDSCQGQCQFCADSANLGHCVTLSAGPPQMAGATTRSACDGTGACQGECKGVAGACTYPGGATECAAASCDADSLQPAATCDGAGQCSTPTKTDCGAYTCDGAAHACKTTCNTAADCAGGGVCITSTHSCTTAGATCDGDYAVKATDGTVTSCNGYRCIANACQSTCASNLDCAPGYNCAGTNCVAMSDSGVILPGAGGSQTGSGGSGSGAVTGAGGSTTGNTGGATSGVDGSVPGTGARDAGTSGPAAPAAAADKGGCGCRTAGTSDGRGSSALLLTLGALVLRRRRRSTALASRPSDSPFLP